MAASRPRPDYMSLVGATIQQLQHALSRGWLTSVELVNLYLLRITTYDMRGLTINSMPVLNPAVFTEAAASDARRAAGLPLRPLEGIPYTLHGNFNYQMGPHDLVENAFVAEKLKEAGAVLIGKTSMGPTDMPHFYIARPDRLYDPNNGSSTSMAACFAAFSVGMETVSTARPSKNLLVTYTPSRGIISCRGMIPVCPPCDFVVPHTRTMDDLFKVLDILTQADPETNGDFWRQQQLIELRQAHLERPFSSRSLWIPHALYGKRIGVFRSVYLNDLVIPGFGQPNAPVQAISPYIIAIDRLQALQAEIVPLDDCPVGTAYESTWGLTDALPARPDLTDPAVHATLYDLEIQRELCLDAWMNNHRLDAVAFLTGANVATTTRERIRADDIYAMRNQLYHGNFDRALRHMGVPTVSVPLGVEGQVRIPVNLTFAGRPNEDTLLLSMGWAFEQLRSREEPPLTRTPPLRTDRIRQTGRPPPPTREADDDTQPETFALIIDNIDWSWEGESNTGSVEVSGHISINSVTLRGLKVYVDGKDRWTTIECNHDTRTWKVTAPVKRPKYHYHLSHTWELTAKKPLAAKNLLVLIAEAEDARGKLVAGDLLTIDWDETYW